MKKIQEITLKNKKHKLLAIKALQFNRQLCIELDDLWKVLHFNFNSAQDH